MKNIRIDFVSDVACPWCAIGLGSLEQAVEQLKDEISVELQFHPFELNPGTPPGGQDTLEHLMGKYGSTREQIIANQTQIQQRAKESGFSFNAAIRPKIYNTFTCHRLLHWAQSQVGLTAQYLLKRELLTAYFTLNEDLDDSEVLLRAVQRAGLNESLAKEVIESDQFTNEVKEAMAYYRTIGITAVPSVIVDGKYLIQGGQSAEVFANSLRQIAAEQTSEIQE